MNAPEELQQIYLRYEQKLDRAIQKASALAGAFNMGDDPRKDACNEVFYEAVEEWTQRFLAENPTSEEAAAAAGWIISYPAKDKTAKTFWYTYAALKHTGGLIPLLTPADASELLAFMGEHYPKRDRLPVQEELVKKLTEQAGGRAPTGGNAKNSRLREWLTRVRLCCRA